MKLIKFPIKTFVSVCVFILYKVFEQLVCAVIAVPKIISDCKNEIFVLAANSKQNIILACGSCLVVFSLDDFSSRKLRSLFC
jgi:hypothetical protein